jgi:hypothetical protein
VIVAWSGAEISAISFISDCIGLDHEMDLHKYELSRNVDPRFSRSVGSEISISIEIDVWTAGAGQIIKER